MRFFSLIFNYVRVDTIEKEKPFLLYKNPANDWTVENLYLDEEKMVWKLFYIAYVSVPFYYVNYLALFKNEDFRPEEILVHLSEGCFEGCVHISG